MWLEMGLLSIHKVTPSTILIRLLVVLALTWMVLQHFIFWTPVKVRWALKMWAHPSLTKVSSPDLFLAVNSQPVSSAKSLRVVGLRVVA